ncbi:MAG TPA: hypothetical protein VFQ51_17215 [Vicinamibacteria bacterium]|nr:hypothetical protein [Vicinamibacteria bacterium]
MSLDVRERGRHIATFRFVFVRLMETAAAWTPTTPEMEVKVLFGRHIWDFAQAADALGRRTFELRLPAQHSLPPAEGVAAALRELAAPTATAERLAGLYDLVLPEVARRAAAYLDAVDRLLDGPSVVILERILAELARQRSEADAVRGTLGIASASCDGLARAIEAGGPLVAEGAAVRG